MAKNRASGNQISPARKNALAALIVAGYSQGECAKILRMGAGTIQVLRKKLAPLPRDVDRIKKGLAAKKWSIADRACDAIDDAKLLASNAYTLSMISAVNQDKALHLEGKASVIIDYQELSETSRVIDVEVVELERKINDLMAPTPPRTTESQMRPRGKGGQFLTASEALKNSDLGDDSFAASGVKA